jgi:hypothetical protein
LPLNRTETAAGEVSGQLRLTAADRSPERWVHPRARRPKRGALAWDILHASVELGIAYAAGAVSGHELASTVGGAIGGGGFGWFMSQPAKASAMAAWVKAYRGMTLNQPSPARIAAFKN